MNMLINARSERTSWRGDGVEGGRVSQPWEVTGYSILCMADAADHAQPTVKRLRRVVKHRENRAWRAALIERDDTQEFEAYEDRQRILDHLSDVWWHGEHALTAVESLVSVCCEAHDRSHALVLAANLVFKAAA